MVSIFKHISTGAINSKKLSELIFHFHLPEDSYDLIEDQNLLPGAQTRVVTFDSNYSTEISRRAISRFTQPKTIIFACLDHAVTTNAILTSFQLAMFPSTLIIIDSLYYYKTAADIETDQRDWIKYLTAAKIILFSKEPSDDNEYYATTCSGYCTSIEETVNSTDSSLIEKILNPLAFHKLHFFDSNKKTIPSRVYIRHLTYFEWFAADKSLCSFSRLRSSRLFYCTVELSLLTELSKFHNFTVELRKVTERA